MKTDKLSLTAAQRWALDFIVAQPDSTPATIGGHCSLRPQMKKARSGVLRTSQGFGRLGAKMSKILSDKGLVEVRPHPGHGKYTLARATALGHRIVKNRN